MNPEARASRAPDEGALWYRSSATRRFVLARFVPLLAMWNLLWEFFQLPFYTLWQEGTPQARAFAVVHCTSGDVLIGTAALLASIMLFARRGWPDCGHGVVLGAATFFGVAYTIFSEWLNTQVTMSWQYSETMLRMPPLGTGIAPLLQWLLIPPLAYRLAIAVDQAQTQRGR